MGRDCLNCAVTNCWELAIKTLAADWSASSCQYRKQVTHKNDALLGHRYRDCRPVASRWWVRKYIYLHTLYSACKRRAVGLLAAASWGLNTPNPSLQSPVSACVMLKMHTTTSRTRVRFFDSVSRGRPRTFQQSRRGQICKYRTPVHGTRPKDTMYNAPVTATLTCSDWSPDGGGDRWVVVL